MLVVVVFLVDLFDDADAPVVVVVTEVVLGAPSLVFGFKLFQSLIYKRIKWGQLGLVRAKEA